MNALIFKLNLILENSACIHVCAMYTDHSISLLLSTLSIQNLPYTSLSHVDVCWLFFLDPL